MWGRKVLSGGGASRKASTVQPRLELLEDRVVPSVTAGGDAIRTNTAPQAFSIKASDFVGVTLTTPLAAEDPNGKALTYSIVSGPSHGSARIQGSEVVYTPAGNFQGADTVRYVANNGQANSSAASVQYDVSVPWAGAQLVTLQAGGLTRTYVLQIPTNLSLSQPVPLVLVLGGAGTTGISFAKQTGLIDLANQQGFIAAFPDAVANFWANGIGGTVSDETGVNDVAFLGSVLDNVAAREPIDTAREFAMGHSMGGMMAERLALNFSNRLAAVGIFSGPIPQGLHDQGPTTLPISVIYMHGTADPIVPYTGGQTQFGPVDSVNQTVQFWRTWDGQSASATAAVLPDSARGDRSNITKFVYQGGQAGTEIDLYEVTGGGHGIPGIPNANPTEGPTNMDINGPTEVWNFFKAHPKSGARNSTSGPAANLLDSAYAPARENANAGPALTQVPSPRSDPSLAAAIRDLAAVMAGAAPAAREAAPFDPPVKAHASVEDVFAARDLAEED